LQIARRAFHSLPGLTRLETYVVRDDVVAEQALGTAGFAKEATLQDYWLIGREICDVCLYASLRKSVHEDVRVAGRPTIAEQLAQMHFGAANVAASLAVEAIGTRDNGMAMDGTTCDRGTTCDGSGAGNGNDVYLAQLPDIQIARILAALDVPRRPREDPGAVLALGSRALFVYGTLRPDYCLDGDKWGLLVEEEGYRWWPATVDGLRLHEAIGAGYPYALASKEPGDRVCGAVITWPGDVTGELFAQKVLVCNLLEGYDPSGGLGLYGRRVVRAIDPTGKHDPIHAITYVATEHPRYPTLYRRLRLQDWLPPCS